MKVLVTGAAGQLGRRVCRLLGSHGISFIATDKASSDQVDYQIRNANLLDWESCGILLEGVDALIHLANHAAWDSPSPQEMLNANTTMNQNLFQAAADAGCRRIVFSSSIQICDGQLSIADRSAHEIAIPYIPMDSDMPALVRNAYALSKHLGEETLRYYSDAKGITCVSIRYPWLLDSETLETALKEGGIERGKCYDCYAYLPIDSAAEAAVKAAMVELEGYRQYFVASKDNLEQREVSEIIEEQLSHVPFRKRVEEMDSLVDCSKVEEELGWAQPESLGAYLAKCGASCSLRENGETDRF